MHTTEPQIHSTAIVDPAAALAEDVRIDAGAYVGPGCHLGPRTRVLTRAIVLENTSLGADNEVHPYAVLGGDPQDRAFDRDVDPGELIIGDRNIFREGVTISRGAGDAGPTRIGSDCFFMAYSHAGHNAIVGDGVVMTNHAAIAGHVRLGDRCVLSAHALVHQFCDVGAYAMFQAYAGVSMHTPPYVIVARHDNAAAGLNLVGLRRSGEFEREDLTQIKEAHRLIYRGDRIFTRALEEAQRREWRPAARRFIEFIRQALEQPPPRDRGVVAAGASRQAE